MKRISPSVDARHARATAVPAALLWVALLIGPASSAVRAQAAGQGPGPQKPAVVKEVLPEETQEVRRLRPLPALIENQGRLHFRYARELLAAGRLSSALEQLDRFLLVYPAHPWRFFAHSDRGRALERLDRKEEAVRAYRAAYREAHNRERGALAFLRAGRLLAELGREAEAREVFVQIVRTRPASRAARLAEIELRALRFLDGAPAPAEPERGSQDPAPKGENPSKEEKPAEGGERPARDVPKGEAPEEAPGDVPAGKKPSA